MFPKEAKTGTPNLVKDLIPIKIGIVYNHITESDVERKFYGLLPLTKSCYKGHIGDLNSESYAKRVNYIGKLVLNDGNSLLGDE